MSICTAERSISRKIYIVLSPRSLPYARCGLQTLLSRALEQMDIVLITDSQQDREELLQVAGELSNPARHPVRVAVEEELADIEAARFGPRSNLRAFRHGHPCWRKITDPLLLSRPGEELIILDPDLYFPNQFRFEQTPQQGIRLMWQEPNCLLPPAVVQSAMGANIRLARHVDIGVAHWRESSADLDWLDWLLGKLGGSALPRSMHVEAIVWAAIAMQGGGGHLDPSYWHCWRRHAWKRVLRRFGVGGKHILRPEPWDSIKCFHAGGEAKWWMADMDLGRVRHEIAEISEPGIVRPFIELTPREYAREETNKQRLRSLDYFHLLR